MHEHDCSPLTPLQQGIYFIDQLYPKETEFNRPLAIELIGKLYYPKLTDAVNEIISRHRNLRSFIKDRDGELVQCYQDELKVDIPLIEIPNMEEAIKHNCLTAANRKITLDKPPLFHTALLKVSSRRHILIIVFQHMIFDATSARIFIQELMHWYKDRVKLLPLELQWGDYAIWKDKYQQSADTKRELEYWQHQLPKQPPYLQLPAPGSVRPGYYPQSKRINGRISPAKVKALKSLTEKYQVTPFIFFLALLKLLFYRYSGQDDIIIGTPVSGRNYSSVESLIGAFINTLAIRSRVDPSKQFHEFMDHEKRILLEALDNQGVAFETLIDQLNLKNSEELNPLFRVLLEIRPEPMKVDGGDLVMKEYRFDRQSNYYDLTFSLEEGMTQWNYYWEYQVEKFDEGLMDQMAGHATNLINILLRNPELSMGDIDLLGKQERHHILYTWNNTKKDFSQHPDTVYQLVIEQSRQTPEEPAVIFQNRSYSYLELMARSNVIADSLVEEGVDQGDFVGICLNRSFDMIAGLLAVMQVGAVMVPLDPEYPRSRMEYMIRDAAIRTVVSQSEFEERFDPAIQLILSDQLTGHDHNIRESTLVLPEWLCYVIYTSGSTGEPKGVMIEHRALCNNMLYRREWIKMTPRDRVLQVSSLSFDASMWEIFYPLTRGAAVVLPESGRESDGPYLIELIEQHSVTYWGPTPALMGAIIEQIEAPQLSTLTHILVGGEELTLHLMKETLRKLDTRLINAYGPTEATISQIIWTCDINWASTPVPIGKPIANMQAYVLDTRLQPVPVGVIGDLYLGGAGLARGYLNKPEQTARAFMPNPHAGGSSRVYHTGDLASYLPDGTILYHGRADSQVKIRGYRIELSEIEHRLNSYDAVDNAVVIAVGDNENRYLAAYLVPAEQGRSLDHKLINKYLEEWLPTYMTPAVMVDLEKLPLSPNGKIDRDKLPLPDMKGSSGFQIPLTDREKLVAALWEDILGQDRVGREDHFFHRGGDSIKAMRMLSRLSKVAPGSSITIRQLFDHPILMDFAALLET